MQACGLRVQSSLVSDGRDAETADGASSNVQNNNRHLLSIVMMLIGWLMGDGGLPVKITSHSRNPMHGKHCGVVVQGFAHHCHSTTRGPGGAWSQTVARGPGTHTPIDDRASPEPMRKANHRGG